MRTSLDIRVATEADRPALLAFHRNLYRTHRDAVVPANVRDLIAYRNYDAVLATDLQSLLSNRSRLVFVAELGGRLIGYITARTEVEPQRVLTRRASVEDWYVDSDHRGTGVGAALLGALEERLLELGCEVLESGTWAANHGARRAHDALGFTETRVTYRKRLGQG